MSKVTMGRMDHEASPLNLRSIRALMSRGLFERFAQFQNLKQEEQLDLMVAVLSLSTGVDEQVIWDTCLAAEFQALPAAFNRVLEDSGFGDSSSPPAQSP